MNEEPQQDRKDVICRILRRSYDGKSVSERAVKSEMPEVHRSALACYGSWQSALAHAGVGTRPRLSMDCDGETQVLQSIRRLCYTGRCLKIKTIRHSQYTLYEAALKHFGSWLSALLAAGINSAQVNAHSNWDRERIVEAILLRAVEKRALGSTTVRPNSLKTAAVREFGSWESALRIAGLNPSEYIGRRTAHCRMECKRRMWDVQRVIKAIRQREVLGLPLDRNSVCRDNRSLVIAARSYFGDWPSALAAAKVDLIEVSSG